MSVSLFSKLIAWVLASVVYAAAGPDLSLDRQALPGQSAADTVLFAAVVRALSQAASFPVSVDPRPLIPDPSVNVASADSYSQVHDSIVALRAAVLRAAGIPETRSPVQGRCPGVMMPIDAGDPRNAKVLHCPAKRLELVAVAMPRRGGAHHPDTDYDEREAGTALGHWSVRVIVVSLGPEGASTVVSDFVFRRANGRWEHVKTQRLIIIE
jgi:hypothetical protein